MQSGIVYARHRIIRAGADAVRGQRTLEFTVVCRRMRMPPECDKTGDPGRPNAWRRGSCDHTRFQRRVPALQRAVQCPESPDLDDPLLRVRKLW